MKRRILFFQFVYLPGYKAGGSLRTLANLVAIVGDEFELKVVCCDRDLNNKKPFPDIIPDQWQSYGKTQVIYLSPQNLICRVFQKIILSSKPDIIYLNSFFHPIFSRYPLILRRFRLIPEIPFIIAPRGEFSRGALKFKWFKKYLYLYTVKIFGLVKGVVWHASSKYEEDDILRLFGNNISIKIASDIAPKPPEEILHKKEQGSLKIIFLSRISQKKNLLGALKMLRNVSGDIYFNIYGPIGDKKYWFECQNAIDLLPPNIKAEYRGEIAHDEVPGVMGEHDLFFLPSFGENYGYVILEALLSGCPVLISDQTPWKGLEKQGIGWDIPLSNNEKYKVILNKCVNMSRNEHLFLSRCARKTGLKFTQDTNSIDKNRELFLISGKIHGTK